MSQYGMFTEAGNTIVDGIVKLARAKGLSWSDVYDMLCTVSNIQGFGEAMDTEVREAVYKALDFDKRI